MSSQIQEISASYVLFQVKIEGRVANVTSEFNSGPAYPDINVVIAQIIFVRRKIERRISGSELASKIHVEQILVIVKMEFKSLSFLQVEVFLCRIFCLRLGNNSD